MNFVALALGANVGDKKENLRKAIKLLGSEISNIKIAPLYQTRPVGFVDQNVFLNTAVIGETDLAPEELLDFVKEIEKKVGRIVRFRWGPREIDIDILLYDNLIFHNERLEIPHPRMTERDFALAPLAALVPGIIHPIARKTISQLAQRLPEETSSILSFEIDWL